MADASIVRNRRKIEAAITNAAAVQRLRAVGGLDEVFWSAAPAHHTAAGRPRRRPGEHPGLRRPHAHPQGPRVRLGGPDHDVRRHAGVRRRQRPRPRLPPERRMRSRFLGQVLAAYLLCRLFSFVVLTVVAGHQAPVTWTGTAPGLPVHDGPLGRLVVPRDRRARLSGAAADRSRHRRAGPERVGVLPRLPAAGAAADDGDRSRLSRWSPRPWRWSAGRPRPWSWRCCCATGSARASRSPPCWSMPRFVASPILQVAYTESLAMLLLAGFLLALCARAVAGRRGARPGHRGHPADRGAPGAGRPGGGRACAGADRSGRRLARGEAVSMVAVLAACGVAGLAWPAIAWWRTGVRSAYTDTMATWRVEPVR